jgi:hypothetical protein
MSPIAELIGTVAVVWGIEYYIVNPLKRIEAALADLKKQSDEHRSVLFDHADSILDLARWTKAHVSDGQEGV